MNKMTNDKNKRESLGDPDYLYKKCGLKLRAGTIDNHIGEVVVFWFAIETGPNLNPAQ